ncbi:MAG: hypothetical protein U0838_16745 [Chloroflexota bacterium]
MVYELVDQFQNLRLGTASAIAYLLAILAPVSRTSVKIRDRDQYARRAPAKIGLYVLLSVTALA